MLKKDYIVVASLIRTLYPILSVFIFDRFDSIDLENFAFCPVRKEMCLYSDPAYPLRQKVEYVPSVSPFSKNKL